MTTTAERRTQLETMLSQAIRQVRILDATRATKAAEAWRSRLDELLDEWALSR